MSHAKEIASTLLSSGHRRSAVTGRARALAFVAALFAGVAASEMPAAAQTWPQRPVHVVVPFGAGSAVDIDARLVGGSLAEMWKQTVVVENQPSGDTMSALTTFIRANDDNRLYFSSTGAFVMHPFLYDKLPYDPDKDFQPIARVSNTVVVVSVPTSLNVSTLPDLIAMIKAQPGKLNWTGSNNIADFVAAGYFKSANLDVVQVPYREILSGVTDLSEGRVQIGVMAYANVRPLVQAGKIKVLAVVTHRRAEALPDVPTAIEAGAAGLTIDGLAGLFGPKSMTTAVRDKIAADVKQVIADPKIASQFVATGQFVNYGDSKEFADAIAEQRVTAQSSAALGVKALR